MANINSQQLKSSEGSEFSEGSYLDRHFRACQPEYEKMLQYGALQPGWHVLDAGCGSGSFLPQISHKLGKNGHIEAIDLAPENVHTVRQMSENDLFVCPVNARIGTVVDLPYENQSFDAIWCSAITQYLTDSELGIMLQEFRRVVKPEGRIIIKDFLLNCWQWQPAEPLLVARSLDAEIQNENAYMQQALRNNALPVWIQRAGFEIVKSRTFMIDRWQPLREVEKEFIKEATSWFARQALENETLSKADHEQWEKLTNQENQPHPCDQQDFYYTEGHIVIVGKNKPN